MKCHEIENISFEELTLVITIDGITRRFQLSDISRKLLAATPAERARFDVSPSGYGIHWPAIDEDLSIDGLLGVVHSPSFAKTKAA